MLKPAQLYEDKLQEENIKSWYDPRNIFYNVNTGASLIELHTENIQCHEFVSVNKNDDVIGYISYNIDWDAMSVDQLGIISYRKNCIEFAKDVYQAICDLFYKYHMNRVSWISFADNPAIKGYRNFVKKHGGKECGYHRQAIKLQDGLLHDYVDFEILASEFHK